MDNGGLFSFTQFKSNELSQQKWVLCLFFKGPIFSFNSRLVPVLTTGRPVLDKISNGADLMAPGVLIEDKFLNELDGLVVNSVCAVRIWGNKAPVAVGVALLSKDELCADGVKGKAVQIVHAYNDALWLSGDQQKLPMVPDDADDDNDSDCLVEDLQNVKVSEELVTESEEAASPEVESVEGLPEETIIPPDDISPTVEYTMDEILHQSFLAAVKTSHKKLSLPILTSTFYSTYVLKCCPPSLNLDIKRTTYKKLSVFLKKMQKEKLVQIKELTKGVESIVGMNVDSDIFKSFRMDPIFKQHLEEEKEKNVEEVPTASIQSNYKFPRVTELHVVSAQVKGLFEKYSLRYGNILYEISMCWLKI